MSSTGALVTVLTISSSSMVADIVSPSDFVAVIQFGCFGLLAYIIWYWLTYIIPKEREAFLEALKFSRVDNHEAHETQRRDYLDSQEKSRKDYLEAQNMQRTSFMNGQAAMSNALTKLTESVNELTKVTGEHVVQARAVWDERKRER